MSKPILKNKLVKAAVLAKHNPTYRPEEDAESDCHDDFFDAVVDEIVLAQGRGALNKEIILALRGLRP